VRRRAKCTHVRAGGLQGLECVYRKKDERPNKTKVIMATNAERARAESQRHGPNPKAKKKAKAKKSRADKLAAPRENTRAASKASYAAEAPSEAGRSSRKSTRSSANRAKPDTNLTLREQRTKGSPAARYRKDSARRKRVRGAASETQPAS